jgi:hypothetical protein
MKRILGVAIISVLAAVLTSGQANARFVASKAACLSACSQQIANACGGFRRTKYNRCRLKLVRQCRRFGPETICPAPLPLSPTTPTTVPVVTPTTPTTVPIAVVIVTTSTTPPPPPPTTTTVTVPLFGTTTTTLPARVPWNGVWKWVGSPSNQQHGTYPVCGGGSAVSEEFTIVQSGTIVTVTVAGLPGLVLGGNVDEYNGAFTAFGSGYQGTCQVLMLFQTHPDGTANVTHRPADVGVLNLCWGCERSYSGFMDRVD